MSYSLKFKLQQNEVWFGAHVNDGWKQPIDANSKTTVSTTFINTYNQATPLWLSNQGRYLWSDKGYTTKWNKGTVTCHSKTNEIKIYDGFKTLRGAYLAASKAKFPFDGTLPNEMMFSVPQYCTWIHLDTNQTQAGILNYAQSILDAGMTASELIIDDGWQTTFGNWSFHPDKFDNPKAMIAQLHEMGFKVILWICPFVAPQAPAYAYMVKNDMLVKNKFNRIASRVWWNGKHPLLDMSNPKSSKWFQDLADHLLHEYHVDGFKQDAGDAYFYRDNDKTFRPDITANDQSLLWAQTARKYQFNELRASFKGGGWGITQRLADKTHSWDSNGLNTLIPNALLQGLSGFPYSCPDMIGGGEIGSFRNKKEDEYDKELLIRWAQCSALMPMMQYSFSLWNLKDDITRTACIAASKTHEHYAQTIIALAKEASINGEPIIRSLEYAYPNAGYHAIKDMFLLGENILVAPVVKKGERTKTISLPQGTWTYLPTGEILQGGKSVTVPAPIDVLPLFERSVDNA